MTYLLRIMGAIILATVLMGSVTTAEETEAATADEVEVVLSVICRANGENPEDGTLTFVLWDKQFNILQRVVNLRGNASFAPLEFSAAGRYVFYITQEGGGGIDIVYDTAVYQVVIEAAEQEGQLAAQISELNRVSGDPMGETQVLETLGADMVPAFENGVRQVTELPPMAKVPETGDETHLWQVLSLFSGVGLLWACLCRKGKPVIRW